MSRIKRPNGEKQAGDVLLGERIRNIRKRLGLNQTVFGEKIGVSATAVGRYEKGLRYPPYKTLLAIAECGEVDTLWLTESAEIEDIGESPLEQQAAEHNREVARYLSSMPCEVLYAILSDYEGAPCSKRTTDTIYLRGVRGILAEDDSLEPLAKKGQFVLVRPFAKLLDGDLVIIITAEDKALVGHVFQGEKKGTYELQNIDQTKPSRPIIFRSKDIEEAFHVIGVVFERLGLHRRAEPE